MRHTYPYQPDLLADPFIDFSLGSIAIVQKTTQTLLEQTTQPVLEVAGPTPYGFVSLANLEFPHGLVISNITPDEGEVDILADARRLPYAKRSLGGIVMANLTRIPEELAMQRLDPAYGSYLSQHHVDDQSNLYALLEPHVLDELPGSREWAICQWANEQRMQHSQRLALLKEARRTLEPGGTMVIANCLYGEVLLLEQLGITLQASALAVPTTTPQPIYDVVEGEMVFALTDLNTPAGQFIEASTA